MVTVGNFFGTASPSARGGKERVPDAAPGAAPADPCRNTKGTP